MQAECLLYGWLMVYVRRNGTRMTRIGRIWADWGGLVDQDFIMSNGINRADGLVCVEWHADDADWADLGGLVDQDCNA